MFWCYHGPTMNNVMGIGRVTLDLLHPPKCTRCGVEGAYPCALSVLADAPKAQDTSGGGLEAIISPFQMPGEPCEVVHQLKYSYPPWLSQLGRQWRNIT